MLGGGGRIMLGENVRLVMGNAKNHRRANASKDEEAGRACDDPGFQKG